MSSGQPPRYLRQREKGRADRAYCRVNGRKHKLGVYGSTESKTKYADLVADYKPKPQSTDTEPTVSELMAAYLPHADTYYGDKTPMWYHVRSFMKELRRNYGIFPASEFRAKKLKELREHWVAQGWSRDYVNAHTGRLKRMFKWAVSEEMIPPDTYHSLCAVDALREGKTTAHDNPPIQPVSDSDVERTLEHLPEPVACMVQIQRLCGCRPGEITKITKRDIDRSGDIWVAELEKHKTRHHGKRRFIYFGPKAQELLLPRLVCADDVPIFPMRRDSYRRAIHRACNRAFPHPTLADIPRAEMTNAQKVELKEWRSEHTWSPNQLRHAAGTEARETMGLEAAQSHLGHSKCDMTEHYAKITEHYAKITEAKALEVARRIG